MWVVVILLLVVIAVLAWFLFALPAPVQTPVATTTPVGGGTTTPDPKTPLHDRVVITSPKAGSTVGTTFTVTGEAPGNWYFEASFPVQVYDKNHSKLVSVPAQAKGDWMTTEQVPFEVTLTVTGYTGPATLVLLKDNPSGLPENEDSVEIPIVIQ